MATADEQAEKEFAAQDKEWTGPKFFATGIVTLIIAVGFIVYMATRTGCTLAIVP